MSPVGTGTKRQPLCLWRTRRTGLEQARLVIALPIPDNGATSVPDPVEPAPVIDTEKRPVLSGILALATVAIVVGVLGGLAILVGVKGLGVGGDGGSGSSSSSSSGGLYLPKPSDTPSVPATTAPSESPTQSEAPTVGITLTASQVTVSPMQQIDLTGTYPTGEGAILQVQRLENDEWSDFPVTMSVSGSTFATYVQTSRPGPNKFRVIDTDTQKTSNEITVTVG